MPENGVPIAPAPSTASGPTGPHPTDLTTSQYLLWMGQKLHPEAPLYNMVHTFEVHGPLDLALFQEAFQSLLDRSDALRTVIEEREGTPRQRVRAPFAYPVELVDLSAAPDPEAASRAWVTERAAVPLDMGASLLDAALLRLGPDRTVWYLNQHHLITDIWSTTLVYRAVADAYERARQGTLADAPPLPAFADYVAHEAEASDSDRAEAAKAYWRERRDTLPKPAALYGRQAPEPSTRTERVRIDLGAERSARLSELAQTPGVRALTPHLTFFSLFATLLLAYVRRASGQAHVAFGTPTHNRPTATFKDTIGLFIEVFPFAADLDADETFASLVAKVQRTALSFFRYGQPGTSSAAANRGFNVVLNYLPVSFPADFAGMPMTPEWVHAGHGDANHHLRLQVHDLDATGRFVLYADLNADLFDAEARERVADHLVRLLDAMLADLSQPIAEADLLGDAERDRLVASVGRADATAYAPPETVVHGFDAQANRTPEAPAIEADGRTTSYRDLRTRADVLAHDLHRLGVESGTRVAVVTTRSAEAVVAYLGVLKAGGAYVPLDPAHPSVRLRALLDEAAPVAILADAASVDALPGDLDAPVVTVDASGPLPEAAEALPPPDSGDLAYVLYTSGSTGRPKGVMIEHSALANYVAWAGAHYGGGRPLDAALFTPLTFDLTVTSLYVPLLTGGRVRVYPEAERAGTTVLQVVEEDAVDLVKLTPSHLALLRGRGPTTRIKRVVLGGEDLKTAQARLALDVFGQDAAVWNEYGPTEATVGCVVHRFDPEADRDASVPIGRPVAGAAVILRNDAGALVPAGVPGEVCLGGPGLARGYLGREAETDARFVHDGRLGVRLYRTGDIGRWREDGTLEYLGREDEQVKVGGVRIELAEVEAALAAHPDVEAAVAAAVAEHPVHADPEAFCASCGLPSTYPGATFDAAGVCHLCRSFSTYEARARAYFRSMDDLRSIIEGARGRDTSEYDCLMLFSGGKDSTYALARLVEMGLRVLTFTLDNGFISEEAKANVRRVADALGVDHVMGSTPAMNAIFVDSLQRHSNVCQGCFKTIYTLGVQTARERGIPIIVTGLSRGQFFETRLTEDLFTRDDIDVDRIDETILEARKAYHRVDDAVRRHLDVEALQHDETFEEVRFVDFYRYCDASLDEMLDYLDRRLPWVRPSDTGRSTNCLINEAGIWVHKRERGFHNYAFPYSWDVRVGHKTREETLDELDDEIDEANVRRMLREIGYDGPALDDAPPAHRLVGYYTSPEPIPSAELREAVAARLPASHVPTAFVRLDAVPTTPNGKVDRRALPTPEAERPDLDAAFVPPRTEAEQTLAAIWRDVLRVIEVGAADNFFDLGGDSILAIQIAARAAEAGLHVAPGLLFQHQTVAALAAAAESASGPPAEQGLVTGTAPLTPVQRWFASHSRLSPWNQAWWFEAREPLDASALQTALDALTRHHDALRLRLDGDRQTFDPPATVPIDTLDLTGQAPDAQERALAEAETRTHAGVDATSGTMVRALHARLGGERGERVLIAIHHLGVDGVSWPILMADLATAYSQARRGEAVSLPRKTASFKRWAERLAERAGMPDVRALAPRWNAELGAATGRLKASTAGTEGEAHTHTVSLSADETDAVLRTTPSAHGARVHEVMLAALAQSLRPLADGGPLRVDVEGHGRDADDTLDVTRTVGWFTTLVPLALPLDAHDAAGALRHVRERWRGLPEAASYGLLRHLTTDAGLDAPPPPAVLFNYLGRLDGVHDGDSAFRPVGSLSLTRHPDSERPYPLEVNAHVTDGRLHVEWTAGPGTEAAVERAASAFAEALRALVAGTDAPPAPEVDASLSGLDAGGLDRLAALLRDADG